MHWVESLMEGAPRRAYSAAFPPDHFYCLLDELPLHLVPQRVLAARLDDKGQEPLFLNPGCIVCDNGGLPDALVAQRELLHCFALQGSMVWVPDASGNLLPFWLGPRLDAVVRESGSSEPVISALDNDARWLLRTAGILVGADGGSRHRRRQQAALAASAAMFQQKGYAPLGELIHPFHVAALRRYYRCRIRSGAIPLGDGQSPRRYVAYNDPVARFFHRQICGVLSRVAGEELKPSYVYLASYLAGAELKKHTDREQCEFSVTLCLDFSPEPGLETPWPIRLDTPSGTTTVYQAIGDGLAYRGTRLPHYREALGQGQTSTSIFFHYVPVDFAGPLD